MDLKINLETELLQFRNNFRRDIMETAEKLLPDTMPDITQELFGLYEKNGNRTLYERVYFSRRRFLAVLGLAAIAQKEDCTGSDHRQGAEKEVLEKLAQVIDDICGEECWALPPHVDRREQGWQVTVDLFAAETAQTLAELAYRLEGRLPARTIDGIRQNVERRVFFPFFSSKVPYRNWEHGMHNWNGVCAGAIGSACIHLMEDKDRLKKSLTRICGGLQYYLKGFEEDGACTEGLGYYTYGMTYFVNFAQELYDATEGECDLFNGEWGGFSKDGNDKRQRIADFMGKCFFGDGRTLSFADGNSRGRFRAGLSCVLAMHYPGFSFPDFSGAAGLDTDGCYRFAGLKMDLLMPDRLMAYSKGQKAFPHGSFIPVSQSSPRGNGSYRPVGRSVDILPCAQWVVARSEAGACMACKGGHNMEFHNHNDVGHFIYEGAGELFFTDLGAGEYRKGYFGEGRYKVLCNRSLGHSVPIINGEEQSAGRDHRCSDFSAEEQDGKAVVRMDIAGAYEKDMVRHLLRRLEFDLDTGMLKVCDKIQMHEDKEERVEENLVTQIRPVVEGEKVLLPSGEWVCVLTLSGRENVHIIEYEHSNHKGVREKVYAVRWEVELKKGAGSSEYTMMLMKMQDYKEDGWDV